MLVLLLGRKTVSCDVDTTESAVKESKPRMSLSAWYLLGFHGYIHDIVSFGPSHAFCGALHGTHHVVALATQPLRTCLAK